MPILDNPRHEKFARLVWLADAKGYRRALAYRAAGYRAKLGDVAGASSADCCASRLLRNDKVKKRWQEIAAMAAKRQEVTQDSLLEELEQARLAALNAETPQASAAVAASTAKAKLVGLMVDRKETGKPGDFSEANSIEDVARMLRESGDFRAAEMIEREYGVGNSGNAEVESAAPSPNSPGSETVQ